MKAVVRRTVTWGGARAMAGGEVAGGEAPRGPKLDHPVVIHFYRALVGHMDVWRQRMDATTNWAAATTAGMVTFTFSSADAPHFVLLLAIAFNCVFLLMESRRYQVFDLWRRRFRVLNRYLVAPVLSGREDTTTEEQQEALDRVASDLGRMVPHLPLSQAVGYRIRRNYAYLFLVAGLAWGLKLEVHPIPAEAWDELLQRAAVGSLPGLVVLGLLVVPAAVLIVLAVRAPSEQMLNWADVPSPLQRWMTMGQEWGRGLVRRPPPKDGD